MKKVMNGTQGLQRQVSVSILDMIAAANDAEAAVPTKGEHDAYRANSELDACTLASTDAEAMDTDTDAEAMDTDTEPDSCDATICDLDSDSHSSWSSTFWTLIDGPPSCSRHATVRKHL